jgi:hypothetical protein
MFLVLREKTNDIWKQKLDWVAQHGGMALINVHPDYISFDGVGGRTEFPVELYSEFLSYVASKYADVAWFALPRQVAEFAKRSIHAQSGPMNASNPTAEIVL